MKTAFHTTLLEFDPSVWNGLAAGGPPMLEWGWLSSLEVGGVASAAGGWRPEILALHSSGGDLCALCPLYLRDCSDGEYFWQEPFLSAAAELGVSSAPRAVAAVPWTPVPGRRVLTGEAPEQQRVQLIETAARVILERARREGWASAHLLFCAEEEEAAFVRQGFFARRSCQHQWRNDSLDTGRSFDDALRRLPASRRNKIRRERKELRDAGLRLSFDSGDPSDFRSFFEAYAATAQRNGEPAPPLPAAFFDALAERFDHRIEFATARRGDEILGRALNLRGDDGGYYGRYWGAVEPPRFLHFEVALYAGIERCLDLGLQTFDPGHGGEHKMIRGFEPTPVCSAHWFAHPDLHRAGRAWAQQEREWVRAHFEGPGGDDP